MHACCCCTRAHTQKKHAHIYGRMCICIYTHTHTQSMFNLLQKKASSIEATCANPEVQRRHRLPGRIVRRKTMLLRHARTSEDPKTPNLQSTQHILKLNPRPPKPETRSPKTLKHPQIGLGGGEKVVNNRKPAECSDHSARHAGRAESRRKEPVAFPAWE